MNARSEQPMTLEVTQPVETRPASWWAWRFIRLNTFQFAAACFFASISVAAGLVTRTLPYSDRTVWVFAAAAAAYGLLLLWPARHWIRVAAVIVPIAAVGSRIFDLLGPGSLAQPATFIVWLFIGFVFVWAGPIPGVMPPPIANGDRLKWLHKTGNRADG